MNHRLGLRSAAVLAVLLVTLVALVPLTAVGRGTTAERDFAGDALFAEAQSNAYLPLVLGAPGPATSPTASPTTEATPTRTPTSTPSGQIAPEDAPFNNPLDIPLDNTVSVLDFVFCPLGDTEDRVRWDITGMNPNSSLPGGRARLTIQASCFGQGTEHIQFFTGGQTYTCGQSVVDMEVAFASKMGSVTITAVGYDGVTNTYVQWVLTGTAIRVN